MSKKVSFGTKPAPKSAPETTADNWVENRATEATKRLTIDIPASLHSRIKAACALQGVKMNEEIRKLLEQHFSE